MRIYIGDGIYAEFEDGNLTLRQQRFDNNEIIVFGENELARLISFINKLTKENL